MQDPLFYLVWVDIRRFGAIKVYKVERKVPPRLQPASRFSVTPSPSEAMYYAVRCDAINIILTGLSVNTQGVELIESRLCDILIEAASSADEKL